MALAFLLGGPALAQDASLDRANLEAAAGRLVFENVLLADPQAFARRTPVRTRDQARTIRACSCPRVRVTLRRIAKPSTLPQAARPSAAKGQKPQSDEANRGSTGKREALGARGIGLAVRAVRSSGRRAQLLPRVSTKWRISCRRSASVRRDGEPRRELTEQPRREGRVGRRSALRIGCVRDELRASAACTADPFLA